MSLGLSLFSLFDIFEPILGVAALWAPVGGWGHGPPHKFGHRSYFLGHQEIQSVLQVGHEKQKMMVGKNITEVTHTNKLGQRK